MDSRPANLGQKKTVKFQKMSILATFAQLNLEYGYIFGLLTLFSSRNRFPHRDSYNSNGARPRAVKCCNF